MKKRTLLIVLVIIFLLLGACEKIKFPSDPSSTDSAFQKTTPEPQSQTKAPTHTPRYLGPIYKTSIFLGGGGWATNVDKTQFFHTTNFGEHWITVTPPDFAKHLRDYPQISSFFVSANTAYISLSKPEEKSLLFRSGDGGGTWETIDIDLPGGNLFFTSSSEGFMLSSLGLAAGSEYVAVNHTTDGGKTWQAVFSHEPGKPDGTLPSSGIKNGITFLDAKIGFITGSEPVAESLYLYRTMDGGVSWEQQTCENLPIFGEADMWEAQPVRRINPSTAFVAIKAYIAERDTTVTHWCKTSDSGETWQFVSSRDQIDFSDFGSENYGVAYGNNKLFRTTDGGETWEDFSHNACFSMVPISVQVVSDTLAYMVCTMNTPEALEALNQNRLFVSMTNARLWQTVEANIIQ